jgi:flagella basal body P-ring formation protein FlgA
LQQRQSRRTGAGTSSGVSSAGVSNSSAPRRCSSAACCRACPVAHPAGAGPARRCAALLPPASARLGHHAPPQVPTAAAAPAPASGPETTAAPVSLPCWLHRALVAGRKRCMPAATGASSHWPQQRTALAPPGGLLDAAPGPQGRRTPPPLTAHHPLRLQAAQVAAAPAAAAAALAAAAAPATAPAATPRAPETAPAPAAAALRAAAPAAATH